MIRLYCESELTELKKTLGEIDRLAVSDSYVGREQDIGRMKQSARFQAGDIHLKLKAYNVSPEETSGLAMTCLLVPNSIAA